MDETERKEATVNLERRKLGISEIHDFRFCRKDGGCGPVGVAVAAGSAASWLLWQRAGEPQRLRPVLALTIATASVHGLAMATGLLSMRWGFNARGWFAAR